MFPSRDSKNEICDWNIIVLYYGFIFLGFYGVTHIDTLFFNKAGGSGIFCFL